MSSITTRSGKGSPLTNTELDANFDNLNNDKVEKSANLSDLANTATARTNLGLATVAASGAYSDLTGKPTIPTVPTNVSAFTNDAGYLTSFTESDPVFVAHAAFGVTSTKIGHWDTAYGWGNHASAGYLTSFTETDPVFSASEAANITSTDTTNWDAAFGWGNHSSAGYLTSFTETDPVFTASPASGITNTNITNWDAAYGWGNHASAGYLTTSSASSTYQTQAGMSSYLTTSSASSIYQTQSGMSAYLALTGGSMTGGFREKKVAMSGDDMDCSAGNLFTKTISGATTLTVSNVPTTGTSMSFVLELTNGGSATITWWSGVKWAGGTAPTLTTTGRDALGFYTHDGGTTWTGIVLAKDAK